MSDYSKIQPEISQPISENLQKLASLFPAAVKDGALDAEALREELGDFAEIQPGDEKYELNWVGKQAAKKKTFEPLLGKTLALKDDGKNTDTTENLYIEGDNLEALKLLRQNYYGEVKMIYIDPPYNTGKDFVYTDKFKVSQEESEEEEGAVSEEGTRLVKNEKSSNRFHARWLDMMYPRLRLAKDLLREDGVIFISIDDGEVANLRQVCDEIFGAENFVSNVIWHKKYAKQNDSKTISNSHDHILVFAKSIESWIPGKIDRSDEQLKGFTNIDADSRGLWQSVVYTCNKTRSQRPNLFYPITNPHTGVEVWPNENRVWAYEAKRTELNIREERLWWGKDGQLEKPRMKTFLEDVGRGVVPDSLWPRDKVGDTQEAARTFSSLLGGNIFETSKPPRLLQHCAKVANCSQSDLILDFFSGSASTAHAAMQLNAEDGGTRQHIMVQLPEVCDGKSSAFEAGYTTISEIGKERIRRAGEKIREELRIRNEDLGIKGKLDEETNPYVLDPDSLDIGFKSFRIEDTKINWLKKDLRGEDIVAEAGLTTADALDFVPGFTDTDVLYELILRQSNIPLTLPISQPVDGASRTYLYGDSYLICLEVEISKELVEQLAALEPTPLKYFFRDSAFGKDIAFKDETFRRLNAEIAKNTDDQADAYTVEFI